MKGSEGFTSIALILSKNSAIFSALSSVFIMAQKYKVYLNSHLIILLFSKDFYKHEIECNSEKKDPSINIIQNDVESLFRGDIISKTLCYHSESLDDLWGSFLSVFEIINAGGGLAKNINKEFLFIFRFNKWDLPKGKLEEGELIEECALREVEEECGVHNLSLGEKIKTTYHIYNYKGTNVLKYSHWYAMFYSGDEKLVPQIEEGITNVEWISPNDFDKVKSNTYQNILDVIE